ncbi:MerR family transcriptional regulator [Nocardioides jiangxiensis]|uniref:MerR family transcriptional regulator n=1 Tax=Nocardioides jiangxiensis TaxID=3064524 RepID=A0ABT9B4A0_9ACTN|nr:MerR family transcriptional regulator [Nocardioides sp. WY-20]MDO7868412.1 MerR family transcriptional regulator [Nocardioides sp. WY-20]
MYTIKRAAEQLGVSESTLRAWERRYGVGATQRTESGYRLYDGRDLHALGLMRALIDDGWPAQAAADEMRRRMASEAPRPTTVEPDGADTDATAALIRTAAALDAPALGALLDRQFGSASFEAVADRWLLPALHALGAAWKAQHVSVAGEHMVAHAITRRLAAAYDAAGDNPMGPRLLIGLPPGARHELGLLAFATAARRAGLSTVYLGADVPTAEWITAATTGAFGEVACAVLAAPTEADGGSVREVAEALRAARPDLLVAVGGSAQESAPPWCLKLGHHVGPGAALLAGRLAPGRPA